MKKLIKRKDGSYSKRGLWDNIRANKGSGKEPTKQMLKQESKIKKEESMNSMYKKGGKASKKPMKKESFMEESKELHFGAPGVNPPKKKYAMGGPGDGTTTKKNLFGRTITETTSNSGNDYTRTSTRKNGTTANSYSEKYTPGETADTTYNTKKFDRTGKIKKERTDSYGEDFESKVDVNHKKGTVGASAKSFGNQRQGIQISGNRPVIHRSDNADENTLNGYGAPDKQKEFRREKAILKDNAVKSRASFETGGKSMAPGGGGRFEALVNKLKSKGKSADQAAGIAASAGRAKYGKGKFQAMAAKGRKKG